MPHTKPRKKKTRKVKTKASDIPLGIFLFAIGMFIGLVVYMGVSTYLIPQLSFYIEALLEINKDVIAQSLIALFTIVLGALIAFYSMDEGIYLIKRRRRFLNWRKQQILKRP